jgi:2-polyprenyl-3-methyl-5-hydroxy-6-metoxy-1,4-benzoquinol methylase
MKKKNAIQQTVQNFYNKTPFPDFELDRFDTKNDLVVSVYPFGKIIDKSIPDDVAVIDVGTGTGQLSSFLSLKRQCVYGIDFSEGSLSKAHMLKQKLDLNSLNIHKINIMDISQIDNIGKKFDYVLCLGVLHHTEDAYQAFCNIRRLLKPEGFIAVGLYNRFGRLPLKVRIFLAKTIFKNNHKVKDYFIRMQIGDIKDIERARGWWNDQYLHPHETTHTVGEVLNWFKKNNIEYFHTVPSLYGQDNLDITGLWYKEAKPSFLRRVYRQFTWIWKTHKEGGYWITFGRSLDVK